MPIDQLDVALAKASKSEAAEGYVASRKAADSTK